MSPRPVDLPRPVEELPPVKRVRARGGPSVRPGTSQSDTEPTPGRRPAAGRAPPLRPASPGAVSGTSHPSSTHTPSRARPRHRCGAPAGGPTSRPRRPSPPRPSIPPRTGAASRGFRAGPPDEYPADRRGAGVRSGTSGPRRPAPSSAIQPVIQPTIQPMATGGSDDPADLGRFPPGVGLGGQPRVRAGRRGHIPEDPDPAGANETTGQIARIGHFGRPHARGPPPSTGTRPSMPRCFEDGRSPLPVRGARRAARPSSTQSSTTKQDGERSEHFEPSAGGFKPALGYEPDGRLPADRRAGSWPPCACRPAVDMGATTVFGAARSTSAAGLDDEADDEGRGRIPRTPTPRPCWRRAEAGPRPPATDRPRRNRAAAAAAGAPPVPRRWCWWWAP